MVSKLKAQLVEVSLVGGEVEEHYIIITIAILMLHHKINKAGIIPYWYCSSVCNPLPYTL